MAILDIFSNPSFYAIMLGLVLFAYGIIKPIVKKLPILRNKQALVLVLIGGFLVTSGILGSMGFGSVAGASSNKVQIADLQVTTSFAGNCTIAANSNQDDLLDVRCTDANVDETAGYEELDTGIITVFRGGNLDAMSCPVVATTQEGFTSEKTPGDGSEYTIVEETTVGELEVYLNAKASGSGAAATTSSVKERTTLEFAEGISQAHLGVVLELEEGAHDSLNQYSYKDVVINVCGKPFTMRVHRMD